MTDIRAVLFDMDGVLVDSFEMWLVVMNAVADRFGAPAISRDALRASFGQGIEEDVQTFFRGVAPQDLTAALEETIPQHEGLIRPNPTTRGALQELGRRDIARLVVTNTQEAAVAGILERCDLAGQIDHVAGARLDVREKPHPDMLLNALAHARVPPTSALMVGDADAYDGAAARAAGVPYLHYDLRAGTDLAAVLREALAQTG